MNKLFSKIAALSVGLTLAIGVGVAIGGNTAKGAKASENVTFDATTDSGEGSITKSGITVSMSTMNRSQKDNFRANSGSDITVTSSAGNITSAAFTCTASGTSNYGPGKMDVKSGSEGTYSYSGKVGTWSGNSTSFVLQTTAQVRITLIEITYDGGVTPVTEYTVTYDANDGTVSPTSQKVDGGTVLNTFPTPTRDGYDFDGWQVNGEGEYVTSVTVNSDITLVAHWTEAPVITNQIIFDNYTSDVTSQISPEDALDYIIAGSSYVKSIGDISKVYKGLTGLKFGTSSLVGTMTINFADGNSFNGYTLYASFKTYGSDAGDFTFSSDGFEDTISIEKKSALDEYKVATFESEPTSLTIATSLKRGYLKSLRFEETLPPTNPEIDLNVSSVSIFTGGESKDVTVIPNSVFTATPVISVDGTPSFVTTSVDGLKITVSPKAVGDETLTIRATNGDQQATATLTVSVADGHGRIPTDPYTVAEAISAITAGGSAILQDRYVAGIICQIDGYNSTYKSITYWISDDGTTTTKLEVYSGKGLNGADFSSVDDLSLKYSVVVNGNLKKYGDVFEFDVSSKLVSYTEPAIISVDSVKTSPESIYVGQSLALTDVELNVTLQGGAKDVVNPTSIELNTDNPGTGVKGKAYYKEVGYAEFTINVVEKDFSGTHVLVSNTTTYTQNVDNEVFHQKVDDSEAFTASAISNFRLGGSPNTTYIMFGGNDTLGCNIKLAAPEGYVITTVVFNGFASNTAGSTLTIGGITQNVTAGSAEADLKNYSAYVFGNSVVLSSASRIWTKSISITLEKYVPATLATEFEDAFIELTAAECAAKAVTETNWTNISKIFGHIESDFSAAAEIVKGHDTTVDAIARYKVIIEKYGYDDFLNKGYVKLSAFNGMEIASEADNSMIIIVSIAATTAVAFAALLIIKKKKHN